MAGTNPESVLAQAGFVPLTPAEPCWFTPAEIWPMVSASERLNLISSLCLTRSVGISQRHRPEGAHLCPGCRKHPHSRSLMTAAWQGAGTLLGHQATDWLGWPWGSHNRFFGGGRAPWGSQFLPWQRQLSRPALPDSSPWKPALETFSTRKRHLSLPRDHPHAWSGCALGLMALEKGECGVLVCLTPWHRCCVAPSHHPPAGWLCLLVSLWLNCPSRKLIWSGQTLTTASFAVCSESFQISDQQGSRDHFAGDDLTPGPATLTVPLLFHQDAHCRPSEAK